MSLFGDTIRFRVLPPRPYSRLLRSWLPMLSSLVCLGSTRLSVSGVESGQMWCPCHRHLHRIFNCHIHLVGGGVSARIRAGCPYRYSVSDEGLSVTLFIKSVPMVVNSVELGSRFSHTRACALLWSTVSSTSVLQTVGEDGLSERMTGSCCTATVNVFSADGQVKEVSAAL